MSIEIVNQMRNEDHKGKLPINEKNGGDEASDANQGTMTGRRNVQIQSSSPQQSRWRRNEKRKKNRSDVLCLRKSRLKEPIITHAAQETKSPPRVPSRTQHHPPHPPLHVRLRSSRSSRSSLRRTLVAADRSR